MLMATTSSRILLLSVLFPETSSQLILVFSVISVWLKSKCNLRFMYNSIDIYQYCKHHTTMY